ncbi:MAG: hypothetical protein HYX39_11565 [Bacteroidetes bacterium]|nr:hypothetical protein [Bacteroidota bacterium]
MNDALRKKEKEMFEFLYGEEEVKKIDMKRIKLNELFKHKPSWGLRGDPVLWDEFENQTVNINLPATEDEFILLIHNLFEQYSGYPITSDKDFFVEKFSKGGMSSGMICIKHWNDNLIPLLKKRFLDIKNSGKTFKD